MENRLEKYYADTFILHNVNNVKYYEVTGTVFGPNPTKISQMQALDKQIVGTSPEAQKAYSDAVELGQLRSFKIAGGATVAGMLAVGAGVLVRA